jgi:hypothetical protein
MTSAVKILRSTGGLLTVPSGSVCGGISKLVFNLTGAVETNVDGLFVDFGDDAESSWSHEEKHFASTGFTCLRLPTSVVCSATSTNGATCSDADQVAGRIYVGSKSTLTAASNRTLHVAAKVCHRTCSGDGVCTDDCSRDDCALAVEIVPCVGCIPNLQCPSVPATYIQAGAPVQMFSGCTLHDKDSDTMMEVACTITNKQAGDTLTCDEVEAAAMQISLKYNEQGAAVVQTSRSDDGVPVADFQKLLRTCTFSSTIARPKLTPTRYVRCKLVDSSHIGTYDTSVSMCAAIGHFAGSDGVCTQCAAGRFQNQTCQTECFACPAGKSAREASIGAASEDEACVQCPAGQYQSEPGQASCIKCGFGKHGDEDRSQDSAGHCKDCDLGHHQATEGEIACDVCEEGSFADEPGQKSRLCTIGGCVSASVSAVGMGDWKVAFGCYSQASVRRRGSREQCVILVKQNKLSTSRTLSRSKTTRSV